MESSWMIIGVDVGGTKIEAVRVDSSFTILARHRIPTEAARGLHEVLDNVYECISNVWAEGVQRIGIGIPGFVQKGSIAHCPNIASLVGVDIAHLVNHRFGVPVFVDNDANCFALAEYELGSGKHSKEMIGIIIGTGVGSGIVINKVLLRGVSGSASEVGHMKTQEGHSWEELLSGPAIVRQYMKFGGTDHRPHPSEIWASSEPAAVKTRETWISDAAAFFASLINAFNPDMIVIGGGVSNIDFYDDLREAVRPLCVAGAFDACKIIQHTLGDSAGVLGAALLDK